VKSQLRTVGGGGDLAKDIRGGLSVALGLDWQSSSRAPLLITDAPGHGRDMNNGSVEDSQPNANEEQHQLHILSNQQNSNFPW
jgi:hypothetical protein